MKRVGSKTKFQIPTPEDDFEREEEEFNPHTEALPSKVQALLGLLSIPFGASVGNSDIDPTGALILFVIDVISALRDVVRLYKQKESVMAKTVGARLVSSLTGEIGKLVIHSLTNEWGEEYEVSKCFHQVGKRILSQFPEMTARKHKVSGKMLIHHTCLKSHSPFSVDYIRSLVEICPTSVGCADAHGALPIHWCLRNKHPSVDVLRLLIRHYPKGPQTKDKKGFIPLHWAVHQVSPNLAIIEELLKAFPDGAKQACGTGGLPLHWAVNHDNPSLPVVMLLLKYFPEAIQTPCRDGWLPIHRAVDRPSPDLEVVAFLIEQYPESLKHPCKYGQLPLHKAIEHAVESFDVVSVLLEVYPNAARMADQDGYLPLHVALDTRHPDEDIVERIIQVFPEACRRPTVDGLLPLHMAIGTNLNPSLRVIAALMQVYPQACQVEVADFVPKDESANAATWQGEWLETRWSPISRALDRELVEVIDLIRMCLEEQGYIVSDASGDEQSSPCDGSHDHFNFKGEILISADAQTSSEIDDEAVGDPTLFLNDTDRTSQKTGDGMHPSPGIRSLPGFFIASKDTQATSPDQTPVRLRPIASNPSIVRTSPLYGGRLPLSRNGKTPPRQSSRGSHGRLAEDSGILPTIEEHCRSKTSSGDWSTDDFGDGATNDDRSVKSQSSTVSRNSSRSILVDEDDGASGAVRRSSDAIAITRPPAVTSSSLATGRSISNSNGGSIQPMLNANVLSAESRSDTIGKAPSLVGTSSSAQKPKTLSNNVASVLKLIGKIPILSSSGSSGTSSSADRVNAPNGTRPTPLNIPLPPPSVPFSRGSGYGSGTNSPSANSNTITLSGRHPSHLSLISNLSDSDRSISDSVQSMSEVCSELSSSAISDERSSDGDHRTRYRHRISISILRPPIVDSVDRGGVIGNCFSKSRATGNGSSGFSRTVNLGASTNGTDDSV